MKTEFMGIDTPTPDEQKRGAEVVFIHETEDNCTIRVLGSRCHESWEQWVAPTEVLQNNVQHIEHWRKHNFKD